MSSVATNYVYEIIVKGNKTPDNEPTISPEKLKEYKEEIAKYRKDVK